MQKGHCTEGCSGGLHCRVMETFNQGILQADAGACRLPIATIEMG